MVRRLYRQPFAVVSVAEASPLGSFFRQQCRLAHRPRVSGLAALGWPISMDVEYLPCFMASAPRTLRELSDHPAVQVVENETDTQDGYWVYLKPGYVWDGTTSHVHESTVKACCEAMADVRWDPIAWGHACGASADEVAQLQRLRDSEVTELREVKNAEGVHVPMAFSRRGRFEFSDSFSLCGAAACLDAAGWSLSEPVAALSRRWADLGQKPNPEGVAMARLYLGA